MKETDEHFFHLTDAVRILLQVLIKLLPKNSTAFFAEKFAALLRHICQRVPVRVSNSHMAATAWA